MMGTPCIRMHKPVVDRLYIEITCEVRVTVGSMFGFEFVGVKAVNFMYLYVAINPFGCDLMSFAWVSFYTL